MNTHQSPTTAGAVDMETPHVSHRGLYIRVAIVLTVLTIFEVSLYVFREELGTSLTVPTLVVLTVIKFILVALYFMHLKFDSVILKYLFLTAVVGAIVLMGLMFLDYYGTPFTNQYKLVYPFDVPTF